MAKITYEDKVGIIPKTVHINQVWDDDMTEIKDVVNGLDFSINQIGAGEFQPTFVSAIWNSLLIFDCTADSYPINNIYYSAPAVQLTLSASDATFLDRIDLIVAKIPVDPAVVGTIQVIEGTLATAALVVPPDFDRGTYFVIKQILVKANATTPDGTFNNEIVYAAGTGQPNEWAFASSAASIVNSGGIIDATNPVAGDKATMMNDITVAGLNSDKEFSLSFDITLKSNPTSNYQIVIKLLDINGHIITHPKYIPNNTYGFDRADTAKQNIIINGRDFVFTRTADVWGIQIYPYLTFDGYELDNITFNIGSDAGQPIIDDSFDREYLIDGYWVDKKANPITATSIITIEVGDQIRGNFAANNMIKANVLALPHATKSNLDIFSDNYLDEFTVTSLITLTSTSVLASWSPNNIVNPGTTFDWTVSGDLIIALTTIDDPTFNFSTNTGNANVLVEKTEDVTTFDVRNLNISILNTTEAISLISLFCQSNDLTGLDVSKNVLLTHINCAINSITALDPSANVLLDTLECNNNSIVTLDISTNVLLETLLCSSNSLTGLDPSTNVLLTILHCNDNSISTLDVSTNVLLTSLNCSDINLSTLDVSTNTALTTLQCQLNSFSATVTNQILANLVAMTFSGTLHYRNNETGQGVTDRAQLITNGASITNYAT